MTLPRFLASIASVSAILLLAGCEGNDAEQAVKDLTGTEEGSEIRDADVEEKTYTVEEINRIRDAETGEVIGEEVKETDVTVQEQVKVKREVDVDSSESTSKTTGVVPEELSDQE